MSGPLGSQQWMYATETPPFYPYTIDNSCRFDGTSFLRRLSATSSALHQFTMSFWVKISNGGSASTPYHLMSFQNYTDSATAGICIYNDSITFFRQSSAYASFNPAKARDYSGWYHVVWKNKSDYYADIYINGVLIGTTSVQFEIINGSAISVGSGTSGNNPFAGGYIADVHFVSGQSLGPDSFGQYDSTGTIWKPKAFSGSHGTDGFHLDFADNTSATTLGYDVSGNSNNFTPSGIATSDQMLDSPTNNFATLNPLAGESDDFALSEGNLRQRTITAQTYPHTVSTIGLPKTGKWYAEGLFIKGPITTGNLGIGSATANSSGKSTSNYGFSVSGLNNGDIRGLLWDADNRVLKTYTNGALVDTSAAQADIQWMVWCAGYTVGGGVEWFLNFGQDSSFAGIKTAQGNTDANGIGDFAYAVPEGALALCTQNLPTPTFDPAVGASPQDAFNVYTDTGANILSTAQGDYSDGLFWIKDYQNAADHQLLNTVTNTVLESNTTDAERAYSAPSGSSVAWAWNAPTVFSNNTDGVITSAGRVNQNAGFSIVNYTTSIPNGTVGHALGETPAIIIAKQTSEVQTWFLLTNLIDGSVDYLRLQTTDAKVDYTSGAFTATTFTNPYALVGADVIAYCFAEKEGFSKFGTYVGNGIDDGPFVYLGFRPAFIMIKCTSSPMNWVIEDAARSPSNVVDDTLYPNLSNAQDSIVQSSVDFLSNGFKIRNAATGWINSPTSTFLYMAFAEQPFRYSNAR